MKFKRNTIKWRQQFTQANRHLWEDRDTFFDQNTDEILHRLQEGTLDTLRDIARELIAKGIYAKSNGLRQVEYMLLAKLHNNRHPRMRWENFIGKIVKFPDFLEQREAA